jgi:SIR2-like protein
MATAPTGTSTAKLSPYRLDGFSEEQLDPNDLEKALTRLRALLAQWLRMENVVVLLGAGASYSQKGPLLPQLEKFTLESVHDLCSADPNLKNCAALLQNRTNELAASKATMTFERWLSYLSNAQFVLHETGAPINNLSFAGVGDINAAQLDQLLTYASQAIYLRCSPSLPALRVTPTGHHALIAKLLARDPALGRASVFTTNYDTLIEQALDELAVQYTDGFVGTVNRRFDPSCYSLDSYYPGEVAEGRVRRFDKFVHLYKLHGSVHWRLTTDNRLIQRRARSTCDWNAWKAKSPANKVKELTQMFADDGDAICILPTENKFVQTLGMPFAHLFRAFHQKLQIPQTFLLVMGYSFGDDHINSVIDDAMTNPSLVLLVVDPLPRDELREKIKRYQKCGERAFLLSAEQPTTGPTFSTFDDFAIRLLPHVQWLDDFIRLRKHERAIEESGKDPV